MRADAEQLPEHDAFTPGVWKHGELSNSGDERGDVDAVPAAKKRKVVAKRRNASSRFRGVSWAKTRQKWVATRRGVL